MSIQQSSWLQGWVNFAVVALLINCQAKEGTGACTLIFDILTWIVCIDFYFLKYCIKIFILITKFWHPLKFYALLTLP